MSKINDSHARETEVELSRITVDVTNQVYNAMDDDKIDKAALARRMGVTRAYVTQLLDGKRNMTLRTIAALGVALGIEWTLRPWKDEALESCGISMGWTTVPVVQLEPGEPTDYKLRLPA